MSFLVGQNVLSLLFFIKSLNILSDEIGPNFTDNLDDLTNRKETQ